MSYISTCILSFSHTESDESWVSLQGPCIGLKGPDSLRPVKHFNMWFPESRT